MNLLINSFVPILYPSTDDYIKSLYKSIILNPKNIDFIFSLDKINIKFDTKILVPFFFKLLRKNKVPTFKERSLMFKILENENILNELKKQITVKDKDYLIEGLGCCNYTEYEKCHFKNMKNLIQLDSSLTDNLVDDYLSQILVQETNHKKAKIDKILKLLKNCKQISPKKVLTWLSNNKRSNEIKYLVSSYPDLKKLVAFV